MDVKYNGGSSVKLSNGGGSSPAGGGSSSLARTSGTVDVKVEDSDSHNEMNHHAQKKKRVKSEDEDSNYSAEDEKPIKSRSSSSARKKIKKEESDYESDYEDRKKKTKRKPSPVKNGKTSTSKSSAKDAGKKKKKAPASSPSTSPKKKKMKEEEEEVWKWWEDPENENDEIKWKTLSHKGPVFAAPYEPLPDKIKFKYDGRTMKLSKKAEEVAGFYARMTTHEYTTRDVFNRNFFKDWRKTMTADEKATLTDLTKCDFSQINTYYKEQSDLRKARSKEEKNKDKEDNAAQLAIYGYCMIDNHKEKIGNFKIEPPGLFRGRGNHPKQGMLKRRVEPEDVIINCSKGSDPKAPAGHRWKEVRHDNRVTWLATWTDNILNSNKYIMLNPSSKLKGQKDMKKYEVARRLKQEIDGIRETYRRDWKNKEMRIRQRAVALYFIDKLALRAGNEKDEGETADTVGCCSLRVEHIKLHDEKGGLKYVVDFDFLGKDSIRYENSVAVEKRVFKNLKLFMNDKNGEDGVFDRLTTTTLNKHLGELMEGLTAKVFRTFNASHTLQQALDDRTNPEDSVHLKWESYQDANRQVAILCNHQKSVSSTFDKQMENVKAKIDAAEDRVKKAKKNLKDVKNSNNSKAKETAKHKFEQAKEALKKLEISARNKEQNKSVALSTSKLNYLDPRITVSWCKANDVPIEKVFNATERKKFRWAIDMAGPDFVF